MVGMAFPVLEILLLPYLAKFPFQIMDSMGVKKFNQLELLKKFMQVGVDV